MGSVEHWSQEGSLGADDESLLRCQRESTNAFGVSFGLFALTLVLRKARKAEKAVSDVVCAFGREEITMMRASHSVDYANPKSRVVLKGVDLVRVNLILQMAGDHAGCPCLLGGGVGPAGRAWHVVT